MRKLFLILVLSLIPLAPFISGNDWSITLHAQELIYAPAKPTQITIDSSNWAKLNGHNNFTGGTNIFDSVNVSYITIDDITGTSLPAQPNGGVPSQYVGSDPDVYLSTPVKWLLINIGGNEYIIPVYNKVP